MGPPSIALTEAPFLEASGAELAAIVERHRLGVELGDIHRLPSTGIVHTIYALGTALVLRVPKAHPDALADARTGALATPVAVAAGVSTPRLIVFDESGDILPVPYSVVERVPPGEPFDSQLSPHPQLHAEVWEALGRDLARLHTNVTAVDDPRNRLDPHERRHDHEHLLADLRQSGHLGHEAATWIEPVLRRLQFALPPPGAYRRFLHGDVYPGNVLVENSTYRAVIDWDDAGWGDPALDFVQLPTRAVDATLAGYRTVAPLDGDDSAEARILWDKLIGALSRLQLEPAPPVSAASPTPSGRLFDLFAAAADGDSAIMRHLRR